MVLKIKVYVVVQALISGPYRFVDVKKTKGQATALVKELTENNAYVGVTEVNYKIIEKEI